MGESLEQTAEEQNKQEALRRAFREQASFCEDCRNYCGKEENKYDVNVHSRAALASLDGIENPLAKLAKEKCGYCDFKSEEIRSFLESSGIKFI